MLVRHGTVDNSDNINRADRIERKGGVYDISNSLYRFLIIHFLRVITDIFIWERGNNSRETIQY